MIWITQEQYDAVMVLISKNPMPDDLQPISILVPPLSSWNVYRESVPNHRLVRKLVRVELRPVLRDPEQSRDEPPEMIWEMDTAVQICDEWLANEMQSMII